MTRGAPGAVAALLVALAGCDPAAPRAVAPAPTAAAAPASAQRYLGAYELACDGRVRVLELVSVSPDGRVTAGAEDDAGAPLRAEGGRLTDTGALSVVLRPAAGTGEVWSLEAVLADDPASGAVQLEGEVVITHEGRAHERRVRPVSGFRLAD